MILGSLPRAWFAILITVLYSIILCIAMVNHELWRDEAQAWMIADASNSLVDIFHHIRYEGHPFLWFAIMWPFTYFDNPDWVKVPHFLLAISTCYLVLRYAPFPRFATVLVVFSYFFLYEYGVISRNYQLGLFGVIGFVATLPKAVKNPWWAVLFLSIAGTANVFSLILALMLGFYYLTVAYTNIALADNKPKYMANLLLAGGVLLAIIVATGISLQPPANEKFAASWYWEFDPARFKSAFALFGKVFICIPVDKLYFWNTSIIPGNMHWWVSISLFVVIALLLVKYPKSLAWFVLFISGLILFHFVKYVGTLRHASYLWISFLVVIWLLTNRIGWRNLSMPLRYTFVALLLIQVYASAVAVAKDISYPFSGSKKTAEFVVANGYGDYDIVGHTDYVASPFTAYIRKPVFYPMSRTMGTYVIWSDIRKHENLDEYLISHEDALRKAHDHTIVVSSQVIYHKDWMVKIFDSGRSITEERYHVYTILECKE